MFTGIVEELGTVKATAPTEAGRRLVISAGSVMSDMKPGDSIAVNGVCLTAVEVGPDSVAVDVVQESLDRSNLGGLTAGSSVDLERPMPASGRFDGHIVQGHVDGVGSVLSRHPEGDAIRMRVGLSSDLSASIVEKGSITVDGVSLTVTGVSEPEADAQWFEIVLIPHTLDVTVLGTRHEGDLVNLEVDVLAKYVAKYVKQLMEAR
jgi:riboflavin synthase